MAKIIEIYPTMDEAKQQIEYRKTFGWKSSLSLNDRGVYEVTFTRDDSTAKNQKLKELEQEFEDCSVAADYIERYDRVTADKRKFKAFHPIVLVVVIYIIFSVFFQGAALLGLSYLYETDPEFIATLTVTAGEEKAPLDENWSMEINLKELGVYELLQPLGVEKEVIVLDTDLFFEICVYYAIGNLAIGIIILGWAIKKSSLARTYYKAEQKYIQKRKDMLRAKAEELEDLMDQIMDRVAEV